METKNNVESASLSPEALYESKMATEQGLMDIARAQLLKEQEVVNKLKFKDELLEQIRAYKHKSMLVSSVAIVDKIDKYLGILEIEKESLDDNIELLEGENSFYKEQVDEYIEEIESLETKIETYWEPRVEKLRNKCIEKNKEISNLKKGLKLLFCVFIVYVFVNTFIDEIIWTINMSQTQWNSFKIIIVNFTISTVNVYNNACGILGMFNYSISFFDMFFYTMQFIFNCGFVLFKFIFQQLVQVFVLLEHYMY